MIRSRDLVLFVVSILFLLLGINVTLWFERGDIPTTGDVTFTPGATTSEVSATEQAILDRPAIIAALRDQIARSEGEVTPQPSVTTDADTAAVVASSTDTITPAPYAQYCLYPDDVLPYVANWPLGGALVQVSGAQREVYIETKPVMASTTTTNEALVRQTFAVLPTNPVVTNAQNCLPSEVVGFTPNGFMIFNTDVRQYRTFGENQLVGYARDGFPIYGTYTGPVDQCGGYQHPAGYRYTVRSEASYLIGCYRATPVRITF